MNRMLASIAAATLSLCASGAFGQSARDIRGADPVVPLENEPPARIVVDPPLPEPLAKGFLFIQYRAENLHIVPVFGPKALDDSPRIGHIHVTVDDAPWHWADASGEPLIIVGLPGWTARAETVFAPQEKIEATIGSPPLVCFSGPGGTTANSCQGSHT